MSLEISGPSGARYCFIASDAHDEIAKYLHKGKFYEIEELTLLRSMYPSGMRFVDVGCNIGNHAVFFEKEMQASAVMVFEVDEDAISLLQRNICINQLELIDTSNLGVALGSSQYRASLVRVAGNLGGTQLVADNAGKFDVLPGDSFALSFAPHFMKIDAEGMEMEVLCGLRETITRHRPSIFIEIDNRYQMEFYNWIEENNYRVVFHHQRYKANMNFLIRPRKLDACI